jgi:nucleoside-diphosphate-sugar epimerase
MRVAMRIRKRHIGDTKEATMTPTSRGIHVIFGAGQVGSILAKRLSSLGKDVRVVSRTNPGALGGARWVRGDLMDEAFARSAAEGAAVVYNTVNPMRYDQWETLLPPLWRSIRNAAARAHALLVVLDNLYMYGVPETGIVNDQTPVRPQSRKGELRARLANELMEAQAHGVLRVSIGRASDFFGAHASRSTTFHPLFFKRLAAGGASPVLGDPDVPHAHAYIPDVAEALLLLGSRSVHSTEPWLLPTTWNGTVRGLFGVFGRIAGRSVKPWRVPEWLWPVASVFRGELRAIPEMLPSWNAPLVVDDSRFRSVFGVSATPVEQAVTEALRVHGLVSAAV